MKIQKIIASVKIPLIVSATFLASTLFAENLTEKQDAMLDTLNALENGKLGLSINGNMKSGYEDASVSGATASGDINQDLTPTRQSEAYTQGNFTLTARPSAKTRAVVEFRVHQDWQSAYTEGPGPLNFRWMSYDGKIAKDQIEFHLGDIHARYTPLTLWATEPALVGEPEIFSKHRMESMSERYLGNNTRPLVGLDATWNSGKLAGLENWMLQGTFARLRNLGKKTDELFFDFGETDKYLASGRFGIEPISGSKINVNALQIFDRLKSSRTVQNLNLEDNDIKEYESNRVLSLDFSFDLASALNLDQFVLGLNGEYAKSNYNFSYDRKAQVTNTSDEVLYEQRRYLDESGTLVEYRDGQLVVGPMYPVFADATPGWETIDVETLDGAALNVHFDMGYQTPSFSVVLTPAYLQNDQNFESFLAMSPVFSMFNSAGQLNQNLNTSSGAMYSSFDALYNSVFKMEPLTQANTMSKWVMNSNGTPVFSGEMMNNYEKDPFISNAYNNVVMTRRERAKLVTDPSLLVALPQGEATPNRVGPRVLLKSDALDGVVDLNAEYSMLEEKSPSIGTLKFKYTDINAALNVHAASLLKSWNQALDLNFGYGDSKISRDLEGIIPAFDFRVVQMSAGLKAGFLNRFALLGGYQNLKTTTIGTDRTENIMAVGLETKISEGASIEVEYAKSKIQYSDPATLQDWNFSRNLISALVRTAF